MRAASSRRSTGALPRRYLLAILFAVVVPLGVRAAVDIQTDGPDPNFAQKVRNAIAVWRATPDCRNDSAYRRALAIVDSEVSPGNGVHFPIRIMQLRLPVPFLYVPRNKTFCPYVPGVQDAHDPGLGSPCVVYWNPDGASNFSFVFPYIPRDPVASLIHELAHAARGVTGALEDEQETGWALEAAPEEQNGGTLIENMYRRSRGLSMRPSYGPSSLNERATRPCCDAGTIGCNGDCVANAASCPTLFQCLADPAPLWCQVGGNCHARIQDAIWDPINRRFITHLIPAWCCPPNSVSHSFRPDNDPTKFAIGVCCAGNAVLTGLGCGQ